MKQCSENWTKENPKTLCFTKKKKSRRKTFILSWNRNSNTLYKKIQKKLYSLKAEILTEFIKKSKIFFHSIKSTNSSTLYKNHTFFYQKISFFLSSTSLCFSSSRRFLYPFSLIADFFLFFFVTSYEPFQAFLCFFFTIPIWRTYIWIDIYEKDFYMW